ncbi:winged helix-turn-helix domain-containing protein [Natrinema ejinorense]|uniref:Transcriptional regulator n=1 Tax=Natrinema ejinorense TaxID=373386 RepID=A0A2A5R147_9EURY|nr:helix-turn-helix domain-containing protein [Natrinema ejinorense]PCR92801.1 transcriptional regulator [Natrinema ejinorense]
MSGERSAAAVFGLLSDETRIDVLREIAIAQAERPHSAGPAELSFSTIYERVDIDNTSKLSYHLGELEGLFLRKGDDGYSLTHAGERIVRLLLSANYGEPGGVGGTAVRGSCLLCGAASLEASLDNQFLKIGCRDCGRDIAGYEVTPAQVRERSASAVIDALTHRMGAHYRQVRGGVCPSCAGRVSLEVVEAGEPDADPFHAIDRCEECLRSYSAPLTLRSAYHPESVAFCWERGVDVLSSAPWELLGYVSGGQWSGTRTATEPDEYEVVYRLEGDELRLELASDLSVTRTERVRRESVRDRRS